MNQQLPFLCISWEKNLLHFYYHPGHCNSILQYRFPQKMHINFHHLNLCKPYCPLQELKKEIRHYSGISIFLLHLFLLMHKHFRESPHNCIDLSQNKYFHYEYLVMKIPHYLPVHAILVLLHYPISHLHRYPVHPPQDII